MKNKHIYRSKDEVFSTYIRKLRKIGGVIIPEMKKKSKSKIDVGLAIRCYYCYYAGMKAK
jgi:ribosomal protein L44E